MENSNNIRRPLPPRSNGKNIRPLPKRREELISIGMNEAPLNQSRSNTCSGDRFYKVVKKNYLKYAPGLPGKNSNVYDIAFSIDKMDSAISYINEAIKKNISFNVSIYDEESGNFTRDEIEKRKQLISYINKLGTSRIKKIDLYLSDETMRDYNLIMYKYGFNNKANMHLSINRHNVSWENMCFNMFNNILHLNIEEYAQIPDSVYKYVKGRLHDPKNEVDKLRKIVKDVYYDLNRHYDISRLTDYEKVLAVYKYVNSRCRFAGDTTCIDAEGHQQIKQEYQDSFISSPVGTWEHKRGVCTGLSRLTVALLNNPYMKVDAHTIDGRVKLGGHEWVGTVINNKLYQSCLTMGGCLSDLYNNRQQYRPNDDQIYPIVYSHAYLNNNQLNEVRNSLLTKKR